MLLSHHFARRQLDIQALQLGASLQQISIDTIAMDLFQETNIVLTYPPCYEKLIYIMADIIAIDHKSLDGLMRFYYFILDRASRVIEFKRPYYILRR